MEIEASGTTAPPQAHLPAIHLAQADWDEVCQEKEGGTFWVSYRPTMKEKALYDKVKVSKQAGTMHCECEQLNASVEWKKRQLTLAPKAQPDAKGVLQAPSATWKQIHPNQRVLCMDVSPGGELGVSGGSDSTVRIWHTKDGILRRDLQGHVGEINMVKWFPSGKVVLTGAQDLQLKIWDAMTGQCAASLRGHAGAITDAAMIDRGRNLLSCSRDGTARLWDVPTQTTLATFGTRSADNYANACWLHTGRLPNSAEASEDGSDQLLFVAKEDGSMLGWDVRTKKRALQWRTSEALNCCLVDGEDVWAGGQDGTVFRWDLRSENLIETVRRSMGPILSLAVRRDAWTPALSSTEVPLTPDALPADGTATELQRPSATQQRSLWVGTNDGIFFEWDIAGNRVLRDMTGSDCDPINKVVVLNDYAFAACGDSTIRKYKTIW